MPLAVSRLISLLFVLGFLVFVWMTYDNVYTDIGPVKVAAEAAACKLKNCKERHHITRLDRKFDGQEIVFQFEGGPVTINCQRDHLFFGHRDCGGL